MVRPEGKVGLGPVSVKTTVMASGAVTDTTCLRAGPLNGEANRASKLALTTAAVSRDPSLNLTPGLSVIVHTS